MNFHRYFFILIFSASLFQSNAQDGEELFKLNCSACHKYTSARLVGPGLAGVHEKWTEDRFSTFVKSSQSMIKSGDEQAVAIFEEYNKTLMPDAPLSLTEIKAVYDFIISKSPADGAAAEVVEEEVVPFTPTADDVLKGQYLFVGLENFTNHGATCNSCHYVRKDKLITGGSFAVELTDSYSRLGKAGLEGVMTGLPFPAMKNTYGNHQLTEQEVYYLTAFLKDVDEESYYHHFTNYGTVLLTWGVVGAFLIMGLIPALWYKRKKESVNQRIYERQIRSNN